jgi:hypothetical protein
MSNKTTVELTGKVIGSLLALALFSVLIKYAFDFTWFQVCVLGYLFWLIREGIQTIKSN